MTKTDILSKKQDLWKNKMVNEKLIQCSLKLIDTRKKREMNKMEESKIAFKEAMNTHLDFVKTHGDETFIVILLSAANCAILAEEFQEAQKIIDEIQTNSIYKPNKAHLSEIENIKKQINSQKINLNYYKTQINTVK